MRKQKKEIFYFFVNISLDPLLILRVTIQKVLRKSFFRACRIFFTFIWKPWINFRGSRLWCDTFMRRLHSCFIFGGRYFVLVWFFFGEYNNRICFLHASACNDTLHFCKDLDLQKNLYIVGFIARAHVIATKTILLGHHDAWVGVRRFNYGSWGQGAQRRLLQGSPKAWILQAGS